MEITVKPLTSDLKHVFVDYLGSLDFSYAPHWASCFCRYYYQDCPNHEWFQRTAQQNRQEALEAIDNGEMQGYLAFMEDQCIGWCNVSDIKHLPRLSSLADRYCQNLKVGCTICFVIHQDYRGQGVASRLLEQSINDYRNKGYDAMIAMPFDHPENPQQRYRGTVHMYERQGYQVLDREDTVTTMWLPIK